MPQAAGVAIGTFFAAAGASVGAAILAAQITYAFVYVGGMMLLNKAIGKLAKKPKMGRGAGLEVNFAGTIEPRAIIFGTVRVGGMHNIPPIATGSKNQYGHADIVVAGHEVADITDVNFDRDTIADADIGAVTGTLNDGLVGGSTKYANKAWIRRYLGTSTQTADYILTQAMPAAFTADFRLRGNSHIAVQCEWDTDVYTSWPNIVALVLGYKVYDPRLDDTKPGGAGTHREDQPSTWAHSSNPALIARHFLVWEVGFSHAEAGYDNDSYVMAAATTCDTNVSIPGGSQDRWTFNMRLNATDPWEENLRLIIDSMRGHCVYLDGGWRIWAGEWQVPDVTINPGDWIAPITVQASANRDERWNFVRGWYIDPNRSWQREECYPRRDAQYEIDDGNERIPLEIELPFCASSAGTKHAEYEAQRHSEIVKRQSRNQIKVTGRLRPEFMKLIPGQTVNLNDPVYGFSAKTFRVVAVESGIGEDSGVDVAFVEEGSATWTDLASGDYSTETVGPTVDPSVTLPDLIADPTILPGPNMLMFNVTSGVPSYQPLNTEYVVIQHSVGTPASAGVEIWRGVSPTPHVLLADTSTRHYWMRAEVGTYKSDYRPNTLGIPAAPYGITRPNPYVLDPDFSRSTSINSLWRARDGSPLTAGITLMNPTIVSSGGLAGSGRLLYSSPNTGTSIYMFTPLPPLPAQRGELFEHMIRWRRTSASSIVAGEVRMEPIALLTTSVFTFPHSDWGFFWTTANMLPVGGPQYVLGSRINTAPGSVWQETRTTYRITQPSTYDTYPHVWLGYRFHSNSAGANPNIEIDELRVQQISPQLLALSPQTSVSAAHVAVREDSGGHLRSTTGGVTINAGVFSVGDLAAYFNNSGSTQNLTAGAGVTFRVAGTTTTGSPRTIAVYGVVSVLCVDTDTFLLSGNIS